MIEVDEKEVKDEEKAKAEARPVIEVGADQDYPLTDEDKDDILRHAQFEFVFGENDVENEMPDEKEQEEYFSVSVPFGAMYKSYWEEALDREAESFKDDLLVDTWGEDAQERRKGVLEDLEQSYAWKQQAGDIISDTIKEYRCGKKRFAFTIPCGYKEVLSVHRHAMDEALENTVISSVFNAHNWKVHFLNLSEDYGRYGDTLDYWIPRGLISVMALTEVIHNKWFKLYAKWWGNSRSGYIALSKEGHFTDRKDWRCHIALLRFWVAAGLYAKKHYIRPLWPTQFKEMEDSDLFSEETGLGLGIDLRLEENAMEEFTPNYDLTKAVQW